MLISGLVSVSFRALSCEEIVALCRRNGLRAIEWGADVHVPAGDTARARAVGQMTAAAGLTVAAYGSYYRLGQSETREFEAVLTNAKLLGADTVRVWAGVKDSAEYTEEEKAGLAREAAALAELAEKDHIRLCFECHPHTLTDEADAAVSLLRAVGRENVKTYWQPNQFKSPEANRHYLSAIRPWLTNLHVFNWQGEKKLPLSLAKEEWTDRLSMADSDGKTHYCLLEFMPDGKKGSLPQEAAALNQIINQTF